MQVKNAAKQARSDTLFDNVGSGDGTGTTFEEVADAVLASIPETAEIVEAHDRPGLWRSPPYSRRYASIGTDRLDPWLVPARDGTHTAAAVPLYDHSSIYWSGRDCEFCARE